jgi:peptide deformylase
MIYPITIIGSSVLRKKTELINKDYPNLKQLVEDMFETMYVSDGVGLAAPQIGKSIRLLVIDATAMAEDEPSLKDFKKVFINAKITEMSEDTELMQEGCLSIPGIHEEVKRSNKVRIQYYDENFNFYDEYYEGFAARVLQHEYDHLDGILFTDRISPIRRQFIKGKLLSISKGKFEAKYNYRLGERKRA